jgi:5-formyltetrahydrofolate cyclo-ligase
MTVDQRAAVAEQLARQPLGILGQTVAGYLAGPTEPDPGGLLAQAARVLLPVPMAAGELGWAFDDGTARPHGRLAVPVPTGPQVGRGARLLIEEGVSVLFVPALGVGRDGWRLGQGGGYYDRLLAALVQVADGNPAPLVIAVVHEAELLDAGVVPHGPHDQRVPLALTSAGLTELR